MTQKKYCREDWKTKFYFTDSPSSRLKAFACGENKVATDLPTGRQVAQIYTDE